MIQKCRGTLRGTVLQYTFKREIFLNEQKHKGAEAVDLTEMNYSLLPEGYDYLSHQEYFCKEFDRVFLFDLLLKKLSEIAKNPYKIDSIKKYIRRSKPLHLTAGRPRKDTCNSKAGEK